METCRACLQKEADNYCSLFKIIHQLTLKAMFHSLTGISVSSGDGLPDCVCQECADFIVTFSNFRKKCLKSDAYLRALAIKGDSEEELVEVDEFEYLETVSKASEDNDFDESENNVAEKIYCKEDTLQSNQELSIEESNVVTSNEESNSDLYDVIEYIQIVDNVSSDDNENEMQFEGSIQSFETDYLDNIHNSADETDEATPKDDSTTRLILRCCGCTGLQFSSVADLKQHGLEVHKKASKSQDDYGCDICYERVCKATKQKTCQKPKARYSCNKCDASYCSRAGLHSHIKSKHDQKRTYVCNVCQKAFYTSSTLISHQQTHGEKKYQCSTCSKLFLRRHDLLGHEKTHSTERPHGCSVCDMRFKTLGHLRGHQTVHTGEQSKKCRKCGKGFRTYSDRRLHELKHENIHPFKCNFCDKTYGRNYKLQVHIRMVHTGEQPFACTDCSKRFFRRWELTAHRRVDHSEVEGFETLEVIEG